MHSNARILPYYTYDEYSKWEGRWEIIEGLPYAMSPAPSLYHQYIANEIKYEFTKAIKNAKCKNCKVHDLIDIKISEDTVIQPDATIICKPTSKKYLDFPAALVLEILSPATALKDRNSKYSIYEKFGIKYYLIVDPDVQKIELYVLNQEGIYELTAIETPGTILFDFEGCKIYVNLSEIFE